MIARSAILDDAEAIAAIYNQGIEEGIATFETRLRTADDVKKWFDDRFPIIVVENGGGQVVIAGAGRRVLGLRRRIRSRPGCRPSRYAIINRGGEAGWLLEARIARIP